jgi:hypothetical protein
MALGDAMADAQVWFSAGSSMGAGPNYNLTPPNASILHGSWPVR